MIMSVVLENPGHPENGVATIPFPIPNEEYDHCMELLEALEIGDAVKADCKVISLDSYYSVLKRMEGLSVNVDELDYLAKRLDSFDDGEAAQFQAMAHKLELFELKDFINLTFCCQQVTVITDFSDLNKVGREHYLNLHGGSAPVAEVEALDGEETARLLIDSGSGTVTPYGVVYDNGMTLEQVYDGTYFPCYHYERKPLVVAMTARQEPENTDHITWLHLPMSEKQLAHALSRANITNPEDIRLRYESSELPDEVDVALDFCEESLHDLNDLALSVERFSPGALEKLAAAVSMAKPENSGEIRRLVENLDQFEFAPKVHTPTELGKYMIQESGYFEYDPNLEGFYNYEQYGLQKLEREEGEFTDRGYISYHGTMSLDELMMEDPAETFRQEQEMQMGRMM